MSIYNLSASVLRDRSQTATFAVYATSAQAPMKDPCVYILASKRNGTLYTGVTSDLYDRMSQHKQGLIDGFTKKYGIHRLVYYEMHGDMTAAILREKRIKEWKRAWKVRLIEQMNPEWIDLFDEAAGTLFDGPADSVRQRNRNIH